MQASLRLSKSRILASPELGSVAQHFSVHTWSLLDIVALRMMNITFLIVFRDAHIKVASGSSEIRSGQGVCSSF